MRVVILAGGLGTRLSEETTSKPKPMVEIGGRPMLWHVMQWYAAFGFTEFVVAAGYRADVVKRYFLDFYELNNDLLVDLATGERASGDGHRVPWKVHVVDTGVDTNTGGRLRRLRPLLTDRFMMTYGDGVGDVDLRALAAFHQAHGKKATVTAVQPPARFGALELDGERVVRFAEKTHHGAAWINGGFFVLEPSVLDEIDGDHVAWEQAPVERLAAAGELRAYKHAGFWQPMDTLREKMHLESLWASGAAPWKAP